MISKFLLPLKWVNTGPLIYADTDREEGLTSIRRRLEARLKRTNANSPIWARDMPTYKVTKYIKIQAGSWMIIETNIYFSLLLT